MVIVFIKIYTHFTIGIIFTKLLSYYFVKTINYFTLNSLFMKATYDNIKQIADKGSDNRMSSFFKWFGNRVNHIFEPEEVEVTFNSDGKNVTYTYTKVKHKQ